MSRWRVQVPLLLALLAILTLTSCNTERWIQVKITSEQESVDYGDWVDLTATVKNQGQPLPNARVTFWSRGGEYEGEVAGKRIGLTNAQGIYRVRYREAKYAPRYEPECVVSKQDLKQGSAFYKIEVNDPGPPRPASPTEMKLDHDFSPPRVQPGKTVTLELSLKDQRGRPLPFVQLELSTPEGHFWSDGMKTRVERTDIEGRAHILWAAPDKAGTGSIRVKATKEGYLPTYRNAQIQVY